MPRLAPVVTATTGGPYARAIVAGAGEVPPLERACSDCTEEPLFRLLSPILYATQFVSSAV